MTQTRRLRNHTHLIDSQRWQLTPQKPTYQPPLAPLLHQLVPRHSQAPQMLSLLPPSLRSSVATRELQHPPPPPKTPIHTPPVPSGPLPFLNYLPLELFALAWPGHNTVVGGIMR